MPGPDDRITILKSRLTDRRSGRVVFLSHCLLNQNTRYLGGACRSCCVDEAITACRDRGLGIVQMPCPEEIAWGGVLKRRYLWLYGRHWPAWVLSATAVLAREVTRRRFRGLARKTAAQIHDYVRSGFEVVAVVGVDGSPSCGVDITIPLERAVEQFASMAPGEVTLSDQNQVVRDLQMPGQGLFTAELRAALRRRNLSVPFVAHDLAGELDGRRSELGERLDALTQGSTRQ